MPAAVSAVPVLTLDAALPGCSVGVVQAGTVLAERSMPGARGLAGVLPAMAASVLAEAGIAACELSLVAVTVGPGSFTGLRAALALAQGIGLAAGVPVVGVTVGEALRTVPGMPPDGRLHWTAVDTRRGRVFLEVTGEVRSFALDGLPVPPGPVVVGGDAGPAVVARLTAGGFDAWLGDAMPTPAGIAAAARHRTEAGLPLRPVQPLYVDPPEARPAGPGPAA